MIIDPIEIAVPPYNLRDMGKYRWQVNHGGLDIGCVVEHIPTTQYPFGQWQAEKSTKLHVHAIDACNDLWRIYREERGQLTWFERLRNEMKRWI